MPVSGHRSRPPAAAGLLLQRRRKSKNGATDAQAWSSLPHIVRLSTPNRPAFRPPARKRASGMFGGSIAAALASASFIGFLAPPSVTRLFGRTHTNSATGPSRRCAQAPRRRDFCRLAVSGGKGTALSCTASAFLSDAFAESGDEDWSHTRRSGKYGIGTCGFGSFGFMQRRRWSFNSTTTPKKKNRHIGTFSFQSLKVVGSSDERAGSQNFDVEASGVGVVGATAEKAPNPAAMDTAGIYKSSISKDLDEKHLDETTTYVFKEGVALVVRTETTADNACQVEFSMPEQEMTLHWAMNNWCLPNTSWWPVGTTQVNDQAVETPFASIGPGHYQDDLDLEKWQVVMSIPDDEVPQRIVFVLRDKDGNWYNNNGCFTVPLKMLTMADLVEQVVVPEKSHGNWSLFSRFILAAELLDAAEAIGAEGVAFIYTWLRFSANKQLTWFRNCNYQSKDISHVQERLATMMSDKVKFASNPSVRQFARMAMATLPRGGGDAEQIRMGILNIMREHGIREGHRPGIEEPFLEQWHQKLHTNTSPEDIHICEAYIHFLYTNNMDNFYKTLWDNGGVSKDWLESMDHPITATPIHLPHLIPAFQHFLWILKTVHSGADLDVMLEMSKGFLDDELKGKLYNILANRDAWWVPGKVVESRQCLERVWRANWASRDVLLLDIALDDFLGICLGRIDKGSLSGDDLCELVALVLSNAAISCEYEDFKMCRSYWNRVKTEWRWTQDWAIVALGAVDRILISLQDYMDGIYKLVQPYAELLGDACGIPESYVKNFGEEVVRGQSLFHLSTLVQKLQPMLRATAKLSSWQVASHRDDASGTVLLVPSLASVQGHNFSSPHIVVTDKVGGMEDIPEGVCGVLCSASVDVLSHVAIRARNSNVFLASCFDEAEFEAVKYLEGHRAKVEVDVTGKVLLAEDKHFDTPQKLMLKTMQTSYAHMKTISRPTKWVLTEEEFDESNVGGKALNTVRLRKLLPGGLIQFPKTLSLPFGIFDKVLSDPINEATALAFQACIWELSEAALLSKPGVPEQLESLRQMVGKNLVAPRGLQETLTHMAEESGLIDVGAWRRKHRWESVWQAICHVWASKWTDRAWLSRRAQGVSDASLYMGCLVQKVVPAEYSFVLHTAHPITKDSSVLFCEVVPGLGEILVNNHSGRALSFSISKDLDARPCIESVPSKAIGLFPTEASLIARSDSNGEDLETFAGAGLYDSQLIDPPQAIMLDYAQERLLWDLPFREQLIRGIVKVGIEVESAFAGQPQDIEGVYWNGGFAVVQSRPQIL